MWSDAIACSCEGVCRGEDARLAVEHGAKAVVVSNHGGRQLDTAPATSEVLPYVIDAVGDLCEVCVDGGIRRGSDALKAIALGALDEAMLLCGCTKLSDVGRWLLKASS